MTPDDTYSSNRMTAVIRLAISDPDVMGCLSEKDLRSILSEAVDDLTPTDVRGFIYRSLTNGQKEKGLEMVDQTIRHAVRKLSETQNKNYKEIISAAVGTMSILAQSIPEVKEKIEELLKHDNPMIVASVVNNLARTSDMENFHQIAELLLRKNPEISVAALQYIEACARDAAFRKRKALRVIESDSEEFLRSALLQLEKIHSQLANANDPGPADVEQRLAILVTMIYSEILDSTDLKRFNKEQVDERIYCALEQHLSENLGPRALPHLCEVLTLPKIEEGVKRSALHTLGRLSKTKTLRKKIISWIPEYVSTETSTSLVGVAKTIHDVCNAGQQFSVLLSIPKSSEQTSIIPRAAGAPPRLKKKSKKNEFGLFTRRF